MLLFNLKLNAESGELNPSFHKRTGNELKIKNSD